MKKNNNKSWLNLNSCNWWLLKLGWDVGRGWLEVLEESELEDADLAVDDDLGTSDLGLNKNTKQYIKKQIIK